MAISTISCNKDNGSSEIGLSGTSWKWTMSPQDYEIINFLDNHSVIFIKYEDEAMNTTDGTYLFKNTKGVGAGVFKVNKRSKQFFIEEDTLIYDNNRYYK